MSSDVACAREVQKIFDPLSISDFGNVSRAQATSGDNLRVCELDHHWQGRTVKAARVGGGATVARLVGQLSEAGEV